MFAFSSEDEPVGQLKEWNQTAEIREQVLIFANVVSFMEIRWTVRLMTCLGGSLRTSCG